MIKKFLVAALFSCAAAAAQAQTTNTSVTCTNQNTGDTCIEFTSLPTTFNTLHFNCTGLVTGSTGDQLVGEVQTGGNTWRSSNYRFALMANGSNVITAAGDGSDTATELFGTHFGIFNASYGASLKADLDTPASTTLYKAFNFTVSQVDTTPTLWEYAGASYWYGATSALTGLRLRNTTAGHTIAGQCTMTGWQ